MENGIREFNASDWTKVQKIYQQGMDTNLATFRTVCPPYQVWNETHLQKCRYVYEEKDSVLGWIALSPVSEEAAYSGVAEVSVYIERRAKHRGIGTLLLKHAIVSSEKEGIWTLQATIMQNNYSCILLFQKCGFRKVGFRNKIARDRFGIWRKVVLMERRSKCDDFDCCCDSPGVRP